MLASTQGAFLNDAYVLDLRTFAWRRPSVLAASPMGRHGALAAVLGGRVVMACGTCASGPLDSIVTMTADFGAHAAHARAMCRCKCRCKILVVGRKIHCHSD